MTYDELLKNALTVTERELAANGDGRTWARRAAILAGVLLGRQLSEAEVSAVAFAIHLARLSERPGDVEAASAALGALAVMSELQREPAAGQRSDEIIPPGTIQRGPDGRPVIGTVGGAAKPFSLLGQSAEKTKAEV